MRVLALSFFDPASVVLSHRDLMRKAGHDFRLAVVRAYTERQRQADYVLEQLVEDRPPDETRGYRLLHFQKLSPDLEPLREFAASADVIQFHPGIGQGTGDWASQGSSPFVSPANEEYHVYKPLGLWGMDLSRAAWTFFFHGSRNTWAHKERYRELLRLGENIGNGGRIVRCSKWAASTIDYATELGAAYLPPLVDVGDLRAQLRGDDDPLLIAHTPTDRVACSTEEFLGAARGLGIPVRLGEGLSHADVLRLKAECNAGFDHLRGAFSVNTLENAAIGLVPLFALAPQYQDRFVAECDSVTIRGVASSIGRGYLAGTLRSMAANPEIFRDEQRRARSWWEAHFSAEPITKRLLKFYESL